jgi:hypothetical protein
MGDNKKSDKASKLRDSIQASLDHAEQERQRELFRRRLDLARKGLENYKNKNAPEAVKAFLSYLRILELGKHVQEGQLTPALFDVKRDIHELLLISGVYWDLAKIFDHTRGADNEKKLRHFLRQYYIFSKGMSYAPLSGETLRKYIRSDSVVHKSEFRKIYKEMTGHNCFVVTSLVDHVGDDTIDTLRIYRDQELARTSSGRLLIRGYYRLGPVLARAMDTMPEIFRLKTARFFDFWAARLNARRCRSGRAGT